MKNVRVRELEEISNDFFHKLGEDEDEKTFSKRPMKTEVNTDMDDSLNNISKKKLLNLPDFSITNNYRKHKRKKESVVMN